MPASLGITMKASYCCHKSTGYLQFDPQEGTKYFEPNWALLMVDQDIVEYYCWHSKKWGKPINPNRLWGAHVSAVKGEEPVNRELWGYDFGEITFYYTNIIRYDNGCHAWLDVWCDRLHEIRYELGLPPKIDFGGHPRHFHLTLGRWTIGEDGN